MLGQYYYLRREYTNAIVLYRKALRFEPSYPFAHLFLGRSFCAMGDYTEALKELELAEIGAGADEARTRQLFGELRKALEQDGPAGYWEKRLEYVERKGGGNYYEKAVAHYHLRHMPEVFQCLNKAVETREADGDGWMHAFEEFTLDECWDGLRDDRQFKEFVEKTGFSKVRLPKKR